MFTASGTSHRKRTSANKHGMSRTSGHNDPSKDIEEFSRVEPSYGNKLLSLRAALNEKELQLVELREQHISVVNRAGIARKNWEDALKSKDQVIIQLQKALHVKKCELDRQERVNEENVQRLLQQREEEENAELEQKERKISHLEAKNTQFVQELVDQQKTITKLKKQFEDRERQCASHLYKIEVINGRVQDLKAALQKKEEVVETQQKYCQELKSLLWKRDSVIGQLQLAEQQLQSSLARQEADYEALECAKQKLQEEKDFAEKNFMELRQSNHSRDAGSVHSKCEKNLKEKESCLRKQRRQIQELRRCLESTEDGLQAKRIEHQHLIDDNRRLVEKHDSLKQDYEAAQQKQQQMEYDFEAVQEKLVNAERFISEAEQAAIVEAAQHAPSPQGSIPVDPAGVNFMDDFLELERQSDASVVCQEHHRPTFPRERKQSSKTPVLYEACRPAVASSARIFSSSARRATNSKDGCRVQQSVRNPLVSEVLDAFVNKHPLSVDHSPRLPKNRTSQETAHLPRDLYQPVNECARKAERKAWSIADARRRQINPTGTLGSGGLNENVVVDSEIKSQSSEISQPSSPSKQDVDSFSEMDPVATEERSPTLVDVFQNSSTGSQKKTPTYDYISRKRTSSHMQRSRSSTGNSLTPSPTDRRIPFSVAVNESKGAEHANAWTMRECSIDEAPRPRDGEMASSNGIKKRPPPTLRLPGSHESPDFFKATGVEHEKMNHSQIGRDSAGRSARQEMNGLNKISGPMRNVSHSAGKLPPTGTKPQISKTSRDNDSLRPPISPSEHVHGSSETALKSLQDEVIKRERGWRRTEANMRAALCQRLAELNGRDHSIKGEDMIEMVERASIESKRPVQRRKT